jgi:hypothetical protein
MTCEIEDYFDASNRAISSRMTILNTRGVVSLAVTTRCPSGENAALETAPEWPSSFVRDSK